MKRWCLVLAVGLSGCREPAPVMRSADVVDSAGIQVITSSAPAWGSAPQWKVASSPSLTLGGVAGDPALDFLSIVGARRLRDGSLVVANGGTGELRWFSPEGAPVRSVGGRHPPTSPFAAIASFYSQGDTLVAWDARARVLTRLSGEGAVLRQDTLRMADTTRRFAILGVFADGPLLAEAGVAIDLKDRRARLRAARARSLPLQSRHRRQHRCAAGRGAPPQHRGQPAGPDGRSLRARFAAYGARRWLPHQRGRPAAARGPRPGGPPATHHPLARLRLPVLPDDIDRQGRALLGSAGSGRPAREAGLDLEQHAETRLAAGHHRHDCRPARTRVGAPGHARGQLGGRVVGDREGWKLARDAARCRGLRFPSTSPRSGSCCAPSTRTASSGWKSGGSGASGCGVVRRSTRRAGSGSARPVRRGRR